MLNQRLATAAVGIPLLAVVMYVGGYLLALVVSVAVFIASIEIWAARSRGGTPEAIFAALVAALIPLTAHEGIDWFLASLALAAMLPGAVFTLSKEPEGSVEEWLWSVTTTFYFGLLAAHFVLLRDLPDGRHWLFFTVLTVWTADTGAYFVGKQIGSRKLAPAISPGKTVEGALGNQVAGLLAVLVLSAGFGLDLSLLEQLALGVLLPPVILIGDLAESALKRSLNIKDSSTLVPGHGGIADRLDSLLFAAPVVFYFLLAFVY